MKEDTCRASLSGVTSIFRCLAHAQPSGVETGIKQQGMGISHTEPVWPSGKAVGW